MSQRAWSAVAVAVLTACGGGSDSAPTTPGPSPSPTLVLTTISVSLSASTIVVGQTATASATGTDQNGAAVATGTVAWSSSSPSVASISAGGVVTGMAAGTAQITASAGGKTAQQLITVNPAPVSGSNVIGSAGGTVTLATGTVVTVPAGALGASSTLQVTESPQLDRTNAADPSWQLRIQLSSGAGATDTVQKRVTARIALQGSVPSGKQAVFVLRDSATGATRLGVPVQRANVAAGTLASSARPLQSQVALGIDVAIALLVGQVTVMKIEQMVEQNAANCAGIASLQRTPNPRATAPTVAVILIHGWQPFFRCKAAADAPFLQRLASKAGGYEDFSTFDAYSSTWTAVDAAIKADAALGTKVDVWVYRYPTTLTPSENAADLLQRIGSTTGLPASVSKIAIIAHSMGGLVARYVDRNSSAALAGIVTLATPHAGSTVATGAVAQYLAPSAGLDALAPSIVNDAVPLPTRAPLHAIRGGIPCTLFGGTALDGMFGALRTVALYVDCGSFFGDPNKNVSDGVVTHLSALPASPATTDIAPQPGETVSHVQVPSNVLAINSTLAKLRMWFSLAPVATVSISPTSASLSVGGTQQYSATLKDAAGNVLTGRAVAWSTSAPSVATVNASGLATAVSAGSTTITASSEGKTSNASVLTASPSGTGLTCTGTPRLGCGLALDQFSLIPAGTFQMGSTSGSSNERPVHSVTISRSFYMQKTEVTQGQWRAVMGTSPSYFSTCGDTCPVETVSWDDIQTFLQRLNAQASGVTYRLPTEAEWEYTARAGTSGETYGTLDAIAWYSSNASSRTHTVAGKQANAWGLYDMHGNVWEWVSDWYGPYSSSAVTDPTGPTIGSTRVTRGNGYNTFPVYLSAAYREGYDPSRRESTKGVRLVRTIEGGGATQVNCQNAPFPPTRARQITPTGGEYSGSSGQYFLAWNLGTQAQEVTVTWNMYSIPDGLGLCFRGSRIFATNGLVSGLGTFRFSYPGSVGASATDMVQSIFLYVSVDAPNGGTAWNVKVNGTYTAPQYAVPPNFNVVNATRSSRSESRTSSVPHR